MSSTEQQTGYRPISAEEADGPLSVGTTVTFTKTVGEFDVYSFAGVSGDFSPNHVDEQYMGQTRYGHRIAHGVLMMAYMSTCSSKLIESAGNSPAVSYGYDHVRFVKPVFINDTVTVTYTIVERNDQKGEIRSDVKVTNQRDEVVAVAIHILRRV